MGKTPRRNGIKIRNTMNAKEKFIFIMLGALFIGAFYYYAMTEDLNRRMDELNLADKNHVDKVLGAYE